MMQKAKQGSTVFSAWSYDTRVIDRSILDGVLTDQDVKSFIQALPNVADKAETMHANRPGQGNDEADDLEEGDDDEVAE
ncbi:MAG: hypothetical protein NVS3B20_22870 [Polyangiales bacterium]